MDYEDFLPELNSIEKRYLKKVQKNIHYCSYDQSYDEGEVVWIFGDKTELTELLYDCNVPEKYWDNVISHLVCPGCGHSNFETGEIVGLQTNYDKEIQKHLNDADKKYGKQINAFEKHLEDNPMLGFQHKFGRKLFNEIKDGAMPTISISGDFYRARKVQSSEVLTSKKMHNAPKGKPTEGRFNHSGQSYFYIANEKETALREVATTESPLLVWCQRFEIMNPVDRILDLTFDWTELYLSTSTLLLSLKMNDAIDRKKGNSDFWRPDYFLTRYIMDCAKSENYNGIKYNSTKAHSGYNLVLFYPKNTDIKAKGKPYIELFPGIEKEENYSSGLFDH